MCNTFHDFSSGKRLLNVSKTGAKPSGAGESGSAAEGSGQKIGYEKKANTWGYDAENAVTETAKYLDEAPYQFVVWSRGDGMVGGGEMGPKFPDEKGLVFKAMQPSKNSDVTFWKPGTRPSQSWNESSHVLI